MLIRPGAIGDCIVSLPALEFLRTESTEVWVNRPNVSLVRFANRVRAIEATSLDLIPYQDVQTLRDLESFDEIVSWYGTNRQDFREAVAHLPFAFHEPLPSERGLHATDFFLSQVGAALGAVPGISLPRCLQDYLAIHPFSGSVKKNWPLANFNEVARRCGRPVEFCVGPDEDLEGAHRFESLENVAEWLSAANVYVGNDSGISHLAAAIGVPVIAIFQHTDPAIWAPRGPNVVVLQDPSVYEVLDSLRCLC